MMAQKSKYIALLIALTYFTYLLIEITIQYIPYHPDVAFLRIKQHYIDVPFFLTLFYVHVYTAIFSMVAGFTQFSETILKRWRRVHRYSGWFYIVIVLLFAAPSGLYIGIYANGGLSSQIAFILLALGWFAFTATALIKIRKHDYQSHRYFMMRSFSLALSAITLRAWKYVIVAIFEPRPMDVYIIVAWLGWILNLFVAELLVLRLKRNRRLKRTANAQKTK